MCVVKSSIRGLTRLRSVFAPVLISLVLMTTAAACSDDVVQADAGPPDQQLLPDQDRRPDAEPALQLPAGGPGHQQVGEQLQKGQVRAGKVSAASQLLAGIKARGRVGDFKIYNSRVAFIIEGARLSDGYSPYGGEVLEAARAGASGQMGESLLGELMLSVGIHTIKPSSVGVISDGADGKPALIRCIGKPAEFPLLSSLLGGLVSEPIVHMVVEYELAAETDFLVIRWRLFNRLSSEQELPMLGLGPTAGDGVDFFGEGVGFQTSRPANHGYIGMVGPAIAYAIVSPEHELSPLVSHEGVWILSAGGLKLPPSGEAQRTYQLLISEGEPEALRRSLRSLRGQPEPLALTGVVRGPDLKPQPGVRVHVESDQAAPRDYLSMTRTDASGAYRLALGPGSYLVSPVVDGRLTPSPTPVKIEGSPQSLDLQVGGSARVSCAVTDAKGPLPAKLTVKPKTPPAGLPASFGEESWPSGGQIRFSTTGSEVIDLPPGEYTITASRGFEYEIDQETMVLADGDQKSLAFQLVRSVSTPGYMCGDFHVHAMWSPDSSDLFELKVAALAAEGLEIPAITEHEYVADLNPTIAKLGLQPWIRGVIGEELTTFVYGHFNPFPMTLDPSKPNQGAVLWHGKTAPQLFDEVRAGWPGAVMQVNHPRGRAAGAYFSYAGYDAATGTAKSPADWSRVFDAVEVFNGSGWKSNLSSTVQDWFSFLDRGFPVTATGNSDSHDAVWSTVGYPRNYVKLSTDQPANLDLIELARSVREGRVVVSGGAFISASIGDKSLGDLVDATARQVILKVDVQAPSWVPLDKLAVIVNGQTVLEHAIDASTTSPQNPAFRFQKDLSILADKDSWLIVVVTGPGNLDPVSRGDAPFAVTNPIYLDVDGNGVFNPSKSF